MSASSTPSQTGGSAGKAVSTPNKRLSSKSYKETVILVVGPPKERYTLHEDLLCFYSDFFRAAFNGSFKEAAERKIELPDMEVEVFEAFQVWRYTQELPQNDVTPTKFYPEWQLLVKLWIFGDKYQIPLLQNNVVDVFILKTEKDREAPVSLATLIYDNTSPSALLRKAWVDIMAHRADLKKGGSIFPKMSNWPMQACLDLIAEMDHGWAQATPRYTFPKRPKCFYHVHAQGEGC